MAAPQNERLFSTERSFSRVDLVFLVEERARDEVEGPGDVVEDAASAARQSARRSLCAGNTAAFGRGSEPIFAREVRDLASL